MSGEYGHFRAQSKENWKNKDNLIQKLFEGQQLEWPYFFHFLNFRPQNGHKGLKKAKLPFQGNKSRKWEK